MEQKENLEDQKQQGDIQGEDLWKQNQAKEEAAKKRLIAKIQREKTAAIKELIDKGETQAEANDDFRNKFNIEFEKLNNLLDELI